MISGIGVDLVVKARFINLVKKFGLRGIPTSILFDKDGFEFARVVGSIDFGDKNFIEWLSNYN